MAISQWANRTVWTDRMLETLQSGVRGGKWHSLIDKVYASGNLFAAYRKVTGKKGAPGVDRQTTQQFETHERKELERLASELQSERYQPQAVLRTWIPKPGSAEKRPLGIPTVRDRVVQTALVHVIEPILDHTFHERSFGFRHGRGAHDALRQVEELLEAGYVYVVDADLKGYFDTIPKDRLLNLVQQHISDSRVIRLIQKYLDQGIMEDLREWTPETGVPQGAVLSPVLSNLYLNPLDHLMAEQGYEMIRYADDFVILCRDREEAEIALKEVQNWVTENGLTLHPTKTQIVDAREKSFAFLGYSFRGKLRFPREKSHAKMMTRICELTPRKSGKSMNQIVNELNSVLRGWFVYFRYCFHNIFEPYDATIRRRLRRMLLKRHRRNPKRLCRTKRWPNAYFIQLGLYNLRNAQREFVQTRMGNN